MTMPASLKPVTTAAANPPPARVANPPAVPGQGARPADQPLLINVTVTTPLRRIALALPAGALVGEVLPHLLRHAGGDPDDRAEPPGGWALRPAGGHLLDESLDLAAQGVRDGDVLDLVERELTWPRTGDDDVVELVATAARAWWAPWGPRATRRAGLAAAGLALLVGAVELALAGPRLTGSGPLALAVALVLLLLGVGLSRALSDAWAGAVPAAGALVYAALGGFLVTLPAGLGTRSGAGHLLAGGTALGLVAVLAGVGVGAATRVFVAAGGIAVAGLVAGGGELAGRSPVGAYTVLLTVATAGYLAGPEFARWWAQAFVPVSAPAGRPAATDAAPRYQEALAGIEIGVAVTVVWCAGVLGIAGGVAAWSLAACVALVLLAWPGRPDARAYRLPPVAAAGLALGILAASIAARAGTPPLGRVLPAVMLTSMALVVAWRTAMTPGPVPAVRPAGAPRAPGGRVAAWLGIGAALAVVPLAAVVLHAIPG
jgi:hypothetical protein